MNALIKFSKKNSKYMPKKIQISNTKNRSMRDFIFSLFSFTPAYLTVFSISLHPIVLFIFYLSDTVGRFFAFLSDNYYFCRTPSFLFLYFSLLSCRTVSAFVGRCRTFYL